MTTKILYQGQITDPSGYAVAGRGYIKSIYDYIKENELDIDFRVISMSADAQNALTKEESEFLDSFRLNLMMKLTNGLKMKTITICFTTLLYTHGN